VIILGLYNGHNASACVLKDGELLINWELERFTRVKHDFGYNKDFIDATLDHCGLHWLDVDIVACNNSNTISQWCEKHDKSKVTPFNIPNTCGAEYLEFDLPHSKGYAINHHLCHLASAYYTSPYTNSVIFSYDGGGDCENAMWGYGSANRIERVQDLKLENVAAFWSGLSINNFRMPRIHAWDPGSGAGKIMGLSSYGKPGGEDLKQLIRVSLSTAPMPTYFDKRSKAFNMCEDLTDTKSERSQTVAATLQSYTIEKVTREINQIKPHGETNLCYSGGLALNCIANRYIVNNTPYNNLHVPPFPNDTGLAIGAALYVWHHIESNPKTTEYFSPYTGPDYNVGTPDVKRVAEYLKNNKIVCYYEGRSESGPRALGHRSILCNPGIPGIRNYLNEKVKHREWYRPYAPVILDKYADEYLSDYNEWSPYMQTSARIKEQHRDILSGVDHVDNTTRPQILKKEHNEILYNIIEASGLPALLNTSFNYQEPIVETPEQAKTTWQKMPVDVLVLGSEIYERKS
tara:strand:- start:2341 stop:3894 length:1554 start_codon:yes stop_codon:yes gene_type:complete